MDIKEAELLARTLVNKHLSSDWQFVWNERISALGVCRYKPKHICLSKKWTLALGVEEVTDTILHEIAHAIAGSNAGHGPAWKAACRTIGAKPERLASGLQVETSDIAIPTHKLVDTTTGKVIKDYYRTPNAKMQKSIAEYYIKGRKEETKGKLVIIETSLLDII